MANYFGNLIQRSQPDGPAIRPVVAPLFAPAGPELGLDGDHTPFAVDEVGVSSSESASHQKRPVSQSPHSVEIPEEEPDRVRAEARSSKLQAPNSSKPVQRRPSEAPLRTEQPRSPSHSPRPTATNEPVPPITRIETRTIERVTQTSVRPARSDIQPRQHPASASRTAEQIHRPQPVRPRIDSFVPPAVGKYGNQDRSGGANSPPTIKVTIGRVDVKLVSTEQAKRPASLKQEKRLALALDEYLHKGGERL